VLTVSLRANGHYGLSDVCLSLPAIVNHNGVDRVIEAELPANEQEALSRSAKVLKDVIAEIAL
jgi:L-lactate dehydrogenase